MDIRNIIVLSITGVALLIILIKSFTFKIIKTIVVASPINGESTEIELKKCPFCGKQVVDLVEERLAETEAEIQNAPILYALCCITQNGGCGSQTGFYRRPIDAINAWNARIND